MRDGVFLVGRHTSVEMNWTDVDWDCDREYDVIRCTIVPVFINGLPVIRNRDWLPTFGITGTGDGIMQIPCKVRYSFSRNEL